VRCYSYAKIIYSNNKYQFKRLNIKKFTLNQLFFFFYKKKYIIIIGVRSFEKTLQKENNVKLIG